MESVRKSLNYVGSLACAYLDICADFRWLRCEALANVTLQLVANHIALEDHLVPHIRVGDGQLEGIDRVSVLLVQWPSNVLVEFLNWHSDLLCDVAHNAVDHLALVVPLLALDDILWADSALGQINVALLLVHSQHDHDLVTPNTDELLDGSNTPSRQFREENHAVDVVIFQQFDVCAHFRDLLHVDHDEGVDFGESLLVEAAICKRHDGGGV